VAALILFGFACTPKGPQSATQALVSRGRVVYQSNCIACHNTDPRKPGSLGPEVWGSSLELVESRVMRAEYPAGVTPKRQTHLMVAIPQLKSDVPALHAFLNSRD
jgi:mono/diheme cytochrome c family protein